MKLALCQLNSVWENAKESLSLCDAAIDGFIASYGTPDVFVFPEFFNTGYTMDTSFSEKEDGQTVAWMKKKAAAIGCAIAGSVPIEENGKTYNRFFFVSETGILGKYDKHHLFTYAGEDKSYTPGNSHTVFYYRGWNISLGVCYDLRFPVWLRNKGCAYDLMLMVANWPDVRIADSRILLSARALENCAFYAFCNRLGVDKSCNYNGMSAVMNTKGELISQEVEAGGSSFVVATIDKEALEDFRQKFPVWKDTDKFEIFTD
ncbi:MAG: nitrilase family protein [Bacteroidales bacterium]|nr:nitrilase family protein [Bacteroidales bacterium]